MSEAVLTVSGLRAYWATWRVIWSYLWLRFRARCASVIVWLRTRGKIAAKPLVSLMARIRNDNAGVVDTA